MMSDTTSTTINFPTLLKETYGEYTSPIKLVTSKKHRTRKTRAAKKKVSETVNTPDASSSVELFNDSGLIPWITVVMPMKSAKKCHKQLAKEKKRYNKLRNTLKLLKTELKDEKKALRKANKKLDNKK